MPLGIHFPRKSHEGYRALQSPRRLESGKCKWPPNQSNASSAIAFHCTAILRPAETHCPLHAHVFLSHVRRQVTVFPFGWMPETAGAHPGWNVKVIVFFINSKTNSKGLISLSGVGTWHHRFYSLH